LRAILAYFPDRNAGRHEFNPIFNHGYVTNYDSKQGEYFFAFIRFWFVLSQDVAVSNIEEYYR